MIPDMSIICLCMFALFSLCKVSSFDAELHDTEESVDEPSHFKREFLDTSKILRDLKTKHELPPISIGMCLWNAWLLET